VIHPPHLKHLPEILSVFQELKVPVRLLKVTDNDYVPFNYRRIDLSKVCETFGIKIERRVEPQSTDVLHEESLINRTVRRRSLKTK
jgi:azurin